MFFTTIYRVLKTSVFSLWRNRWLSLAASLIMVLTLFSISFFISLLIITKITNESLKSRVDIVVYFNESTSKDQIFSIQNNLQARPEVKSIYFVSKEEALKRWQERNTDNDKIKNLITEEDNPLPRSLEVKTEQLEQVEPLYNYLNSEEFKPLIKEISYQKNKKVIDRMMKLTKFTAYAGWGVSFVFILISVLVIYNTVMLTIFARKEEIEIMKLVGASDFYLHGPFLIEGLSYGLVGAIASSVIFYFVTNFLKPGVFDYLELYSYYNMLDSTGMSNFWVILGFQLVVGLFLGALCSMLAIRKHLK
jgi:cell division transport system permease protein